MKTQGEQSKENKVKKKQKKNGFTQIISKV